MPQPTTDLTGAIDAPVPAPAGTASVVIVTNGRADKLRRSVAAVLSQTRPPDELVIVNPVADAATTAVVDELAAAVPSSLRLVHLTTPMNSIALGENYGMVAATGDIIAFTDDDAEVFPDWLERISRFYQDPAVGGVCGRDIIYQDGVRLTGRTRRVGRISWRLSKAGFFHLEGAPRQRVSVMKGVNMSVRRGLTAMLDERLLGPNEACWEDDLSLHIRRLGYDLWFDPEIVVNHYRAGGPVALEQQYIYFHNETYVLLKYSWLPQQLLFVAWSFTIGLLVQLITALRERRLIHTRLYLRGRVNGLRSYVAAVAGKELASWR